MLQVRGSEAGTTRRTTTNGVEFFPGFPRRASSQQLAPASGTAVCGGDCPVMLGASVARARYANMAVAGVGETMTVDVFRVPGSGPTVSLLVAPVVINASSPVGAVELLLVPGAAFLAGDSCNVVRTYVAGGGPNMKVNAVFIDYGNDTQPV